MQPTDAALQVFYGTLPLIGVILLAIWTNNARLSDLRDSLGKRIDDMGKRIDDLRDSFGKRIDHLADRVSELEKGNQTDSTLKVPKSVRFVT